MSQRIDALICPRWTVRVEPQVVAEEGLAVAVDDGRVLAVMERGAAERQFAPTARYERPGHLLLPGFVNAHTHAAMTLMRGFADDLPFDRWLHERIWPAERRWLSPELVAAGTRLAIAEMLRGGTTCFSDMYFFPDVVGDVASELGMRAVVGMIVLDAPSPWARDADEYLSKGLAVHDRFKGDRLVTTAFAPHAPYSVGGATLERVRRLADELERPVHMHVHETAAEIAAFEAATGVRPLARLDALGLVSPLLNAVHATQLNGAEIELLAAQGASVVHCPRSNMKLASGACPVDALRRAGVNVALGTDGAASNNRLDMLAELESAALLAKHVARDAAALPAAAAVEIATIGGARALGLAGEIGSIVPGKAADLTCVDLTAPELAPVLDPLSQLVYAAAREHVSDVWVAGEHLVADGKHARLDAPAIAAAAQRWGEQFRST